VSLRAALCAVGLLLAVPGSAFGATGSVSDGVLTYTGAGAGEDVVVNATAAHYELEEKTPTTTLTAGAGCDLNKGKVRCPKTGVTSVDVDLGAGDDKVLNRTLLPVVVDGGDGSDRIDGGVANDVLEGGAGADVLNGSFGDDQIEADDGAADSGTCGTGSDAVTADPTDVFDGSCEVREVPSVDEPDEGGEGSGDDGGDEGDGSDDSGADDGGETVFEEPIGVSFGSATAPFNVARGTVALQIACGAEEAAGCVGNVALALPGSGAKKRGLVSARRRPVKRRRAVKIGSRRFRLDAGGQAKVAVRLSRRGRRALGSRRRTKVQATITMNTAAGKRVETRMIVVERRVARRPRKPPRRTRGRRR
jgi:hypothetical protein